MDLDPDESSSIGASPVSRSKDLCESVRAEVPVLIRHRLKVERMASRLIDVLPVDVDGYLGRLGCHEKKYPASAA